jgi:hypothetical protein
LMICHFPCEKSWRRWNIAQHELILFSKWYSSAARSTRWSLATLNKGIPDRVWEALSYLSWNESFSWRSFRSSLDLRGRFAYWKLMCLCKFERLRVEGRPMWTSDSLMSWTWPHLKTERSTASAREGKLRLLHFRASL